MGYVRKDDKYDRLMLPHGGYRKLRSFQTAKIVYDATLIFCDRFIDRYSRTHDQMVQAARSGAHNIAEGGVASATSKKTEIRLTNVAKDSLPVAPGDSLFCDLGNRATLRLATGCEVLLKAPRRLATWGDTVTPKIGLVQGEVFLKREWSNQAVAIVAKGCTFTPAGTAAAVKFTKPGEPTTAVLRGSVKMETADGRSITVGPRSFGTLDANSTFRQGEADAQQRRHTGDVDVLRGRRQPAGIAGAGIGIQKALGCFFSRQEDCRRNRVLGRFIALPMVVTTGFSRFRCHSRFQPAY